MCLCVSVIYFPKPCAASLFCISCQVSQKMTGLKPRGDCQKSRRWRKHTHTGEGENLNRSQPDIPPPGKCRAPSQQLGHGRGSLLSCSHRRERVIEARGERCKKEKRKFQRGGLKSSNICNIASLFCNPFGVRGSCREVQHLSPSFPAQPASDLQRLQTSQKTVDH